jgi:PAT family beta-lactamase induction signal transducer AmpG
MTLSNAPRLRLAFLSVLYLTQGIPTGFGTVTLAALLADWGFSASVVAAFLAMSYLPWALKLLYGPLVDRYAASPMGRRRPWILIAQVGMVLSLGLVLMVPNAAEKPAALAALLFLHNTFGSLQDVATDGLAVDLLDADERGVANGVMWSGKVLGIALGGAGLSTLIDWVHFAASIWAQIGVLSAAVGLLLVVRERPGNRLMAPPGAVRSAWTGSARGGWRRMMVKLRRAFRPPAARAAAGLALVAALPTRMLVAIGPVFAVQAAGWSDLGYSQFTGGPALLMGAAGAALGGWVADRLGRRRTLVGTTAGLLGLLFVFTLARSWWQAAGVVVAFVGLAVFLDMMLKTTLAALFMDTAREEVAATQFTAYMTLGNLCNVLGSGLIVPLDALLGFQGIFLFAVVVSAGVLVFLYWSPVRQATQRTPAVVEA